jgi:hypothetical protein
MIAEEEFHRVISLERQKTEHTRKRFVLMLVSMDDRTASEKDTIVSALSNVTSDTDVAGWYKKNSVVGVIFREFEAGDRSAILNAMMTRVSETLRNNLSEQQFGQISISFHLFPEEWNQGPRKPSGPVRLQMLAWAAYFRWRAWLLGAVRRDRRS